MPLFFLFVIGGTIAFVIIILLQHKGVRIFAISIGLITITAPYCQPLAQIPMNLQNLSDSKFPRVLFGNMRLI